MIHHFHRHHRNQGDLAAWHWIRGGQITVDHLPKSILRMIGELSEQERRIQSGETLGTDMLRKAVSGVDLLLGAVNEHIVDSNIADLRNHRKLEPLELVRARANSTEFIHPVVNTD